MAAANLLQYVETGDRRMNGGKEENKYAGAGGKGTGKGTCIKLESGHVQYTSLGVPTECSFPIDLTHVLWHRA
jgi:hypothetical protein